MILAHGGGVPETLSIMGPLAVVGILVVMERRARRAAREREAHEPPPDVPEE